MRRIAIAFLSLATPLALQAQTLKRPIGTLRSGDMRIEVAATDAGYVSIWAFQGVKRVLQNVPESAVEPWVAQTRHMLDSSVRVTGRDELELGGPYLGDVSRETTMLTRTQTSSASIIRVSIADDYSINHVFRRITRSDADSLLSYVTRAAREARSLASKRDGQPSAGTVAEQTYFDFQVERQVTTVPGQPGPQYPDALKAAHVEGEVLAQFVVDATGRADLSTFKVIKSTHELFTAAVRESVARTTFTPAEVGGRKVRQLVQMPFQFNLTP